MANNNPTRLSDEDFFYVYGLVPRLNLDLVIRSESEIVLAQRSIEPNNGCWHLPGSTLYKGETVSDAAQRIAEN